MMCTKLHWVDGPWPGKLALAARPRGGEWLEDELIAWSQSGAKTVLSLLTPDKERDLEIAHEAQQAEAHGIKFLSFPILDRQVPESEGALTKTLENLKGGLPLAATPLCIAGRVSAHGPCDRVPFARERH